MAFLKRQTRGARWHAVVPVEEGGWLLFGERLGQEMQQPGGAQRQTTITCGGLTMAPSWRFNKREARGGRQQLPGGGESAPFEVKA